jgi:hypothetical protein
MRSMPLQFSLLASHSWNGKNVSRRVCGTSYAAYSTPYPFPMTPYLNETQEILLHELLANAQCDVETVAEILSASDGSDDGPYIVEFDGL